jgi:hypothetical protein
MKLSARAIPPAQFPDSDQSRPEASRDIGRHNDDIPETAATASDPGTCPMNIETRTIENYGQSDERRLSKQPRASRIQSETASKMTDQPTRPAWPVADCLFG